MTSKPKSKPFSEFCYMLTVLFIGLKLTDHVDWLWLWILSPLWIEFISVIVIMTVIEYRKVRK